MYVKYIQHCGDDLTVVNAARVSFNKQSDWESEALCPTDPHTGGKVPPYKRLKEKDKKLIKYLASHKHKSPFNHTWITLHVKAPIFIARQLVKHKFMVWNEVSRRYVDENPEFYWPEKWRARSKDKKQGSDGEIKIPSFLNLDLMLAQNAKVHYNQMISDGVCPEQARMILPLNTYTEWYWSGTLGAWSDMYNLRAASDTQLETQEVARMCGNLIEPLFPVSWKELIKIDNE